MHPKSAARPGPVGQGPDRGSGTGGGAASRRHPCAGVWNDAAEGRHRFRQDGGVSRGRGRNPARRAAGAGPVAGDCADGGVPDPGRGALRRETRRMAFRRHDDRAASCVAHAGARRGTACGGRAVRAVPAVPGTSGSSSSTRNTTIPTSRGGGRALQRPRHGRAARLAERRAGGARLGHAVAWKAGPTPRRGNTRAST